MDLLLDTHTLLWWFGDDRQLPAHASRMISSRGNTVLVSTVTAWEIATKFRLGRLPTAAELLADFSGYIEREGFTLIELNLADALRGGALPGPHKDPFDRMLIAQALERHIAMVTNEKKFELYGVLRVWE